MSLGASVVVATLLVWLMTKSCKSQGILLPISPDIHMMTECDKFQTSVHVFNPDKFRGITYGYKVYADLNDNSQLDSTDYFLFSEPKITVGPEGEHEGIIIRPNKKFKGYSMIVQVTTKDMITYYASIPCDVNLSERDSSLTK